MEIQIQALGSGFSLTNINFGINVGTVMGLSMRATPKAKPYHFGIYSIGGFGGKSGTVVLGYIKTAWMRVDYDKHSWLYDKKFLIGKKVQIELKGTLIIRGKVDVNLKIIGEDKEIKFSLSKVDIESIGGQFQETAVRGIITPLYSYSKDTYKINPTTGRLKST